jgi:hypothetical protein
LSPSLPRAQHCFNLHLNEAGCHRDRACPFLHSSASASTSTTAASSSAIATVATHADDGVAVWG